MSMSDRRSMAERDDKVIALKQSLRKMKPTVEFCPTCQSFAPTCQHIPALRPNKEWESLNKSIKSYQGMAFCKACKLQREDPHWIRCPFCSEGGVDEWIGNMHNLPMCEKADSNMPYCGGCGQEN